MNSQTHEAFETLSKRKAELDSKPSGKKNQQEKDALLEKTKLLIDQYLGIFDRDNHNHHVGNSTLQ